MAEGRVSQQRPGGSTQHVVVVLLFLKSCVTNISIQSFGASSNVLKGFFFNCASSGQI